MLRREQQVPLNDEVVLAEAQLMTQRVRFGGHMVQAGKDAQGLKGCIDNLLRRSGCGYRSTAIGQHTIARSETSRPSHSLDC